MAYIELIMQLSGVMTVIIGIIRKDLVLLTSGFTIIVVNLTNMIYENKRKIDKVQTQLNYERRLNLLERKLELKCK